MIYLQKIDNKQYFKLLIIFSAKELIQPYVREVILELLKIIRETENDDLTQVVQKIVCMYVEEVTPIAVEMTSHLVSPFPCRRDIAAVGLFCQYKMMPKALKLAETLAHGYSSEYSARAFQWIPA